MLKEGDLLTPAQALRLVPLPKSTFYDLLKDGTIPSLPVRRTLLIERVVLERFVDGLRLSRPTAPAPVEEDADAILRRIEGEPE